MERAKGKVGHLAPGCPRQFLMVSLPNRQGAVSFRCGTEQSSCDVPTGVDARLRTEQPRLIYQFTMRGESPGAGQTLCTVSTVIETRSPFQLCMTRVAQRGANVHGSSSPSPWRPMLFDIVPRADRFSQFALNPVRAERVPSSFHLCTGFSDVSRDSTPSRCSSCQHGSPYGGTVFLVFLSLCGFWMPTVGPKLGGEFSVLLPPWTKKVIGVFLGPRAGRCGSANCLHQEYHVEEHGFPQAPGAITFTSVCEHCKSFSVEDFLLEVFTKHGER